MIAVPPKDERIGPGQLVLVVGPSGAGKDTLIRSAREQLADDARFVFPRRTVTRPSSEAEDNDTTTEAQFSTLLQRGHFALHWTAHGLSYGVPAWIDSGLAEGRTVVCNVSRLIVAEARRRYANVLVIEVTAPPEVLAERLASRGRAEDGEISRRLNRSSEIGEVQVDLTIRNVGARDRVAASFIAALPVNAEAMRPLT